jgi:hypothetical protein
MISVQVRGSAPERRSCAISQENDEFEFAKGEMGHGSVGYL